MSPRYSRSAGWTCIALAKVGSLFCLWQVLRTADAGAAQTSLALPLAGALALGAVAAGLWMLKKGSDA